MALTPEQIAKLKGSFIIKCVKAGGYTMTGYGGYSWAENEQQNLVDDALPDTLRAGDYWTARNMCRDPARELAQRIEAGDFIVVEEQQPDPSVGLELSEG